MENKIFLSPCFILLHTYTIYIHTWKTIFNFLFYFLKDNFFPPTPHYKIQPFFCYIFVCFSLLSSHRFIHVNIIMKNNWNRKFSFSHQIFLFFRNFFVVFLICIKLSVYELVHYTYRVIYIKDDVEEKTGKFIRKLRSARTQ